MGAITISRDFQTSGECLVSVKGCGALAVIGSNGATPKLWQLGLADTGIRIVPRFFHKDVIVDDFGPDVPAEVLVHLLDVTVHMNLIYYDTGVLESVMSESTGGSVDNLGAPTPGTYVGAGTPMGGGVPLLTKGNHYISLNLTAPQNGIPWHFPSAYLYQTPVELPIGTTASVCKLVWRAIAYTSPLVTNTLTTFSSDFITVDSLLVLSNLLDTQQITLAQFTMYKEQILNGETVTINLTQQKDVQTKSVKPVEIVSKGAVVFDRFLDVS